MQCESSSAKHKMSACINLFALHYFLWFAAISSIYGYVSVYAKHYANASSSQYGLLNMILSFATIGSKLLFCSLADRYRAYRAFFITFLITALIGFGSFALLPFLVTPQAQTAGVNVVTFGVICAMTSVGTISMSVISCLSDAFAVNSAKKRATSYGMIRLWGTIGWGLSAFLLAFINQIQGLPFLVPGLIMLIILLTVDILAASLWTRRDDFKLDKSASGVDVEDIMDVLSRDAEHRAHVQANQQTPPTHYGSTEMALVAGTTQDKTALAMPGQYVSITSVKMQWILFKEVASRRRSIFRYMTLFTISGALIALQWSYFFLYLENIYADDFFYISSISMLGQSMLGELPFFLLSQYVIKLLGRSHTLSVSIASVGVRYLLYRYLLPNASMYFVLVSETLQGPNFGLYYVVMTEVGLDFSDCEEAIVSTARRGMVANKAEEIDKLRQALRATMQSIMSVCYEGLGVGIGSILGGLVIDHYGFPTLWLYSALIAIGLGIANSLIDLLKVPILVDQPNINIIKS